MAYPKSKEAPIPAFDPNKPFTPVKGEAPAFDPNKPFTEVKKKEVSDIGLKEPLGGVSSGTTSTAEPLPSIELYKTNKGDLIETDPFSMIGAAKKLSEEGEFKMGGGEGSGRIFVPDEKSVQESKTILEDLDKQGYKKDFIEGITDIPQAALNNPTTSKEKLVTVYKENPIKFKQLTNEAKTKYAIADAATKKAYEELEDTKDKDEIAKNTGILEGNKYSGDEATPESMQQFYAQIKQKQDLINKNIEDPEQKKKLQESLKQTYSPAISPQSLDFKQEYEGSGLSGTIDINQYAGLKTLELFEPEKYKTYLNVIQDKIVPQWNVTVQTSPEDQTRSIVTDSAMAEKLGGQLSQLTINQRIGKEEVLRELAQTGASNEYDNIVSEQNDLKEAYKKAENDDEKLNIYTKSLENENRLKQLEQTEIESDKKYPLTAKLKYENQVKELVNDRGIGVGGYMYNKYAHGIGSSVDAVENIVTNIFGSETDKTKLRLKRIGENKQFEAETYLPENERRVGSPVIIQASDELKKKVNKIMDGRSLSSLSEEERKQISDLVANNQDQIKTITNPEAGKSKNFLSKATGMTIAGFTADIGSFLTKMAALGATGIGTKAAEATTLFTDGYDAAFNQKISEGASTSEANEYGMLHGAILSLMTKFGSKYETIMNVVKGGKSPLSRYIAGMSEETWNKLAAESKPLLSKIGKTIKEVGKEQGKMVGTFGVLAPTASSIADNIFYDENKSVGQMSREAFDSSKEMLIGSIGFIALGLVKGAMKGKATPLEKSALWEIGDNPEIGKERIDEAVKSNDLTKEEGDKRKEVVDRVSKLIDQVPTENDKGKILDDQQRINYLYNLAVKESYKEKSKTLPEKQAEDAKKKALVADKVNSIELEGLTEKQLNDRKDKLEKDISKVDEKGKPELSDKEMSDAKIELEALNTHIDKRKYTSIKEELPDLTVPIEGTDKKGVPIGEDVPLEVSVEPPRQVPQPVPLEESTVSVEPPKKIPEPIKLKEPNEEVVTEETKLEIQQPTEDKGAANIEPTKATLPTEEVKAGGGKEPPKPPKEPVEEGGDKKGITHAAVAELRKIVELPEYEGKPKETHEQLIEEAQKTIKDNPNAANEVIEKMEKGGEITNKDNAIAAVYKATVDAALEKNPSKELLDQATRLAKALDVSGTKLGKALESRKLVGAEDNLANFLMGRQADKGTALTEKQIKDESAKYIELKQANEVLQKQLETEREQHAKDIAELGLNKARAKAKRESKKSNEDYKAERKASVDAAREALKKLRTGESGTFARVPLANELSAIAPHVKDFFNSLASQGIDKLDNVITEVHAEFKDILEGLSKKNILDIVSGDFDAKREKTRNEKAANIRLLQREVDLLKELERARLGEEKSKSETEKTSANRRIDELKEKIKEVRRINKDREIDIESPEDATAGEIEYNAKLQKKLIDKAQKLTQEIKDKKFLEEKEIPPPFKKSRKTQMLEDKVIDLENKIRHDKAADEYAKRSVWRKGFDKVMEVLGVKRLVQTALDMSTSFRQGATLLSPRKIDVWAKGFKANLQSILSPKKFERIMYAIRKDPMYHDMIKDEVVFNDLGSVDPTLRNEDFRKSFVYKIPLLREPLKASNRSADAFLNVARFELYKKLRRNLEQKGYTREADPKAFKYIGNWTMSMTGRGKMHSALEKPAMNAVLGNTFYGARLMASRFNLLNPVTYFDPRIPKAAKVEAMKDMAAFTGTMITVGTILSTVTGAKISLNPDDSDFLQLRYGDKVYDISGGLANYVRTGLRIGKAGYTKLSGTKYQGGKATENAGKSFLNFFRNKLAPNTSYGVDAFFGANYGQDFDPTSIYEIYPMYTEDLIKAYKDEGILATATVLAPNILGIGYGSYASKGEIDKNLEDLLERNLRSDEMDSEKIHNYKDKGRVITFKEFNDFADKRDKKIEDDIKVLFEKGIGGTPYKDLTPEQVIDETTFIKANATREVKKEMFGEKPKKKGTEKREDKKLLEERKEKYKNN